jgi:hypothetical protein
VGRTSVGEKVCRKTVFDEQRSECIDVSLLVAVGVTLGVRRASCDAPGIVVGDVGDETANCGRRSCSLVKRGKELSSGLDVGSPAEPSSMTGIKVHDDVLHVERLDGVGGECLVGGGGICALGDIEVSDQVGQRVGLCLNVSAAVSGDGMYTYQRRGGK